MSTARQSPRVVSVAQLACLDGFELDETGTPQEAVTVVDLSAGVSPELVAAAAERARRSLSLTIGVATAPVTAAASSLLDALTFTVVPSGGDAARTCVAVDDPAEAVTTAVDAVRASPRAAVTLGQVLRADAGGDLQSAVATEAAAYSMLLTGTEFRTWLDGRASRHGRHVPSTDSVVAHRDGDVLRISLARPQQRNAMDAAMRELLVDALAVGLADDTVTVVLDGQGPDFCAGGDLAEFGTATDFVAAYLVRLHRHPGLALSRLGRRATVQVHGACIGAGIEIPAFAATVVARDDAYFRLPELAMGLIPGAGGTASITRRIGRWRTAWMALTAANIDADRALDWGLVDRISP